METATPYVQHARSLRAVFDSYGVDCPFVVWNAKNRRVIPTSAQHSKKLQAGGFFSDSDVKFETLVSEFNDTSTGDSQADALVIKNALLEQVVTYQGDQFKVESVRLKPGALQMELICNLVNQQVQ